MNCFDVLAQTRFLIIGGSTKLATVLFSFMHHKNMFPQSFFTLETITTFWTGVSGSFVMNKGNMFVQTFFCFVSITTSWTFKIFRSIMFDIHMSFQFSNLSKAQTTKMASKRLLSLMHWHNMAFHCKLTVENPFALLTFHRRRLFSFMQVSLMCRLSALLLVKTLSHWEHIAGLGFFPSWTRLTWLCMWHLWLNVLAQNWQWYFFPSWITKMWSSMVCLDGKFFTQWGLGIGFCVLNFLSILSGVKTD